MLIGSFGAVVHVDAANKAQVLDQHISEAMYVTAVFLLPRILIFAASFLAFTVGSLLRPRRTSVAGAEVSRQPVSLLHLDGERLGLLRQEQIQIQGRRLALRQLQQVIAV